MQRLNWILSFLVLSVFSGLYAQFIPQLKSGQPIKVRLLIFSGREDPTWRIYPSKSWAYQRISNHVRSFPGQQPNTLPRLGYNGFQVSLPGQPLTTITARSNPSLESLLLYTGRQQIDRGTFDYVKRDIFG